MLSQQRLCRRSGFRILGQGPGTPHGLPGLLPALPAVAHLHGLSAGTQAPLACPEGSQGPTPTGPRTRAPPLLSRRLRFWKLSAPLHAAETGGPQADTPAGRATRRFLKPGSSAYLPAEALWSSHKADTHARSGHPVPSPSGELALRGAGPGKTPGQRLGTVLRGPATGGPDLRPPPRHCVALGRGRFDPPPGPGWSAAPQPFHCRHTACHPQMAPWPVPSRPRGPPSAEVWPPVPRIEGRTKPRATCFRETRLRRGRSHQPAPHR